MNKLNSGINNGVASDQFMECTWMKKGKSEDGVIGNIQKPETSTTWVYSRNSPQTLINDLRAMTEDTFKISKVGWVRVRDHEYEYFVAWKLDGEYEYEYEYCE